MAKISMRNVQKSTVDDFSSCPVYWTAAIVDWYHRFNKEELKCTTEAVPVISMHSKAPAEDQIDTAQEAIDDLEDDCED